MYYLIGNSVMMDIMTVAIIVMKEIVPVSLLLLYQNFFFFFFKCLNLLGQIPYTTNYMYWLY